MPTYKRRTWAPARLTALGYAIVGDFEGAIYCWRQVARQTPPAGEPVPDARTLAGALLLVAAAALATHGARRASGK